MDQLIEDKFAKMGARVKVRHEAIAGVRVNVLRDRKGEYFDVAHADGMQLSVPDVRAKDRHLLLAIRRDMADAPSQFLCGHDERAWFVAAIPESAGAGNVDHAKDALKPAIVRFEMRNAGVRHEHRNRRKTQAFVRQGEWFFIPRPWINFPEPWTLKNEPIRRGAGKPHYVEELIRQGGEVVYVHRKSSRVISAARFASLSPVKQADYTQQRRGMGVFARGAIRHADHKTIHLPCWHQVVLNTETNSLAMRHVAFID